MSAPGNHSSHGRLQAVFLAVILPRVEQHARVSFRNLAPAEREEATAEARGLAWRWFLRLAARRKDATRFPTAIATFAARAVRSGRRVCGQEPARDALSPLAQARRGFTVIGLPDGRSLGGNVLDDALRDNTRTPPDEQAAFRLDFPRWRRSRCARDRRLIDALMAGGRTLDVARGFGLIPGRVSQLRRAFHDDWRRFCGEPAVAPVAQRPATAGARAGSAGEGR
jgi:hypothetical protein